MSQGITIALPDDLQQILITHATQTHVTVEELILQTLTQQFVKSSLSSTDANQDFQEQLLGLIGTLPLGTTDLAENHDRYLGQDLYQELRNVQ
jgi:hypothetical protein